MSSTGTPSMPLKLKINTNHANASSPPNATPTPSSGLKLSFSRPLPTPTASSPAATTPKATKKPANPRKPSAIKKPAKKRPRDADSDEDELSRASTFKKKQATTLKLKSEPLPSPILKLKPSIRTPYGAPARLKLKHKGKPPVRPLGVGYDSEADDAEVDPAIEENFILRMAPGPDCDFLRRVITEGKLGTKISEGGPNVALKFFSKDGRRACLSVQGRHYAAILVDLPTIIESMKSWDRRGWWKSADICQMLIVLPGVLSKEDDARAALIPKEWKIDEKLWQWPHGLTPPMRNCRTRRFRKRVSHRTIEKAEEEVERLLALDEKAKFSKGGNTEFEIIDLDRMKSQDAESQIDEDEESEAEYEYEEDAEGDPDVPVQGYEDGQNGEDEDEEDPEELARRMELELGADDDEDEPETPAIVLGTPTTSTPAPESAVFTPTAEQSTSAAVSDDDGDDGEDDEESDEDANEEEREQAQYVSQQREEIAHLEREISMAKEQLVKQSNPLFRQRLQTKIKSLQEDLEVKKSGLGEGGDDEDEEEDDG